MKRNWINQLGDWNPQVLREIKGRWKIRNILLAIVISLLGQIIVLIAAQSELPSNITVLYNHSHKYCTGQLVDRVPKCLADELGNVLINWQLWSLDVFIWLSIIGCFAFLVGGTYLLISDLAHEERRDTLNFIRLSPQSPHSILLGKMLGVPILLYLVAVLAIPLHLWLGLSAKIPLTMIFIFYTLVFAANFFYYSGALLFSLVASWLGSFQAWLGSGIVLGFMIFSNETINHNVASDNPLSILNLINPCYLVPQAHISSTYPSDMPSFTYFHWFSLPIGEGFLAIVCFALLIYAIGSYFIWQSLQRCFRDSHTTMLSKQQSYVLTTCFTIVTIGCANWQDLVFSQSYDNERMAENLAGLLLLNFGLFLYLISALSTQRQTLQDWARYRHVEQFPTKGNRTLIKDLIWSEKSPVTLAIAINVIIAISGLSIFILAAPISRNYQINMFLSLAVCGCLAVIYAALAQLLLFMKSEQRFFWTTGGVGTAILLPPIISTILFSHPGNNPVIWLFTVFGPLMLLFPSGNSVPSMAPFMVIISYLTIAGLLIFQLTRTLKKVGESATKALLSTT